MCNFGQGLALRVEGKGPVLGDTYAVLQLCCVLVHCSYGPATVDWHGYMLW